MVEAKEEFLLELILMELVLVLRMVYQAPQILVEVAAGLILIPE